MIQIRRSQTHGLGVFAAAAFARRSLVGIYAGRRRHAGERMTARDDGVTYLFGLSDGATIDGSDGGNDTRFINHSCHPNCVAVEAYDEADELVVEIRAKRRIQVGEELYLDYALVVDDAVLPDYVCLCGERVCRGTMAAPIEVAKRGSVRDAL